MTSLICPIDTYMEEYGEKSMYTPSYSELKAHEKQLKADIIMIKGELAEKKAYLASLDEKLSKLEYRQKKLLEEKQRITAKLNSYNGINSEDE